MQPSQLMRRVGWTKNKRRYYLVNGEPFFREDHNFATGPKVTPPGCPPTVQFDPAAMPLGTQLAVPRITMRPGEVARFRLLNAMSDNVMPIAVEGHDLQMIELDGVNFPTPQTRPAGHGSHLLSTCRCPGEHPCVW